MNSALAFAETPLEKGTKASMAVILDITHERAQELINICKESFKESDRHTAALSAISQKVLTPQELMLTGYGYLTMCKTQQEERQKVEAIKELFEMLTK